jgi:hypothetical protein
MLVDTDPEVVLIGEPLHRLHSAIHRTTALDAGTMVGTDM